MLIPEQLAKCAPESSGYFLNRFSNNGETGLFSWIRVMARPSSGPTETVTSLDSFLSSASWMESVTTTCLITEFSKRSTAGPEDRVRGGH